MLLTRLLFPSRRVFCSKPPWATVLQGAALVMAGLDRHLHAAAGGGDRDTAGGVAAADGLALGQQLALGRHECRGLVALFYVDVDVVVGRIAVSGGAYALGHALARAKAGATGNIAAALVRNAAVTGLL